MLAGFAPGSAVWRAEAEGDVPRRFISASRTERLHVRLDEYGRHQVEGDDGASALTIHAGPDALRVTALSGGALSPLLRLWNLGLATIPYAAAPGLVWRDVPPIGSSGLAARIRHSWRPYLPQRFAWTESQCVAAPGPETELTIETRLHGAGGRRPTVVRATIGWVSGPTKIEADFDRGRLRYTLVSFKPGLPASDE